MPIVLTTLHVIVCIALILIVLLQTGKGANMGAAFGAGSNSTLFGTSGATSFLSKMTTVAAVVFMLTSLGLAYFSGNQAGGKSIMMDEKAPVSQPATAPPAATDAGTPSKSD